MQFLQDVLVYLAAEMLSQVINAEQSCLAVSAIHRAIWKIGPVTFCKI
jgi:hypothetical protein